ncbi:helix-turn-helix domain-containing protein, partial [Megasphaera sp. UBA4233]
MSLVTENTGKAIRTFRKKNKLTVQELADRICKSKATVSKYESGKISLDLDTLFDIAQVLQVRLEQLLYMPPENVPTETVTVPNFFKNLNHMYIYMYDGRNNHLNRTIIDVFPENQH